MGGNVDADADSNSEEGKSIKKRGQPKAIGFDSELDIVLLF